MRLSLQNALRNFADAYNDLFEAMIEFEERTGSSVNDIPDFVEEYPFDVSFDELEVEKWCSAVREGLRKEKLHQKIEKAEMMSFHWENGLDEERSR